jgi:hypothetical protein
MMMKMWRRAHILFRDEAFLPLIALAALLLVIPNALGKDEKDPSFLDHNIDKHAIFTLPLSQGAYDFDVDGFVREFAVNFGKFVGMKLHK